MIILCFSLLDYVALSNMPAESTRVLDDNWRHTKYAPTPIMSTYLLAFVIADYTYKEKVSPKNYTVSCLFDKL